MKYISISRLKIPQQPKYFCFLPAGEGKPSSMMFFFVVIVIVMKTLSKFSPKIWTKMWTDNIMFYLITILFGVG